MYLYLNVYCQCLMLTVCTKGQRVTQFQFSVCMYCTCGRIDNKADLTLLSTQTFEKVIHAFVTSRLDYCNSLYYGINQSSMERLQLVQNAAARLLTGTRKFQHITPILTTLQWLPVKLRVEYKILTLVFKALNNLAPIYLTELLQTHKSVRPLRSRFLGTLSMPRSRLKHRGDRAFVIVGPTLWNNLPVGTRTTTSLSIFKVMLKSHLLDRFAANQWRVFVSIYWDFIIFKLLFYNFALLYCCLLCFVKHFGQL